jgi:integrase
MGTIREVIRKDGSKTYHAEVRLKGHPPARDSFRTLTKAKKWIQDTESSIRDGRYSQTRESKRHTVGEMIDRFITQWLSRYPQRIQKQKILLGWWKQHYGHMILSDFVPARIAEGRDILLSESTPRKQLRSSSTVNRYLSAIGKALTISMKEWGWIEENPMRKVSKLSEGKGRDRFLSKEEQERLLTACRESRNPNLYPIVAIALLTGMRYGEIVNLKWGDIDFHRCLITLHRTKNGDKRYIPLAASVEKVLKENLAFGASLEARVFQSHCNRRDEHPVSIREAFEGALRRAQINDCRLHDLRHTAASNMAMAGATQGELMAILGHRSPTMTRRYAHYSQQHLKDVLERTDHIFLKD